MSKRRAIAVLVFSDDLESAEYYAERYLPGVPVIPVDAGWLVGALTIGYVVYEEKGEWRGFEAKMNEGYPDETLTSAGWRHSLIRVSRYMNSPKWPVPVFTPEESLFSGRRLGYYTRVREMIKELRARDEGEQ